MLAYPIGLARSITAVGYASISCAQKGSLGHVASQPSLTRTL